MPRSKHASSTCRFPASSTPGGGNSQVGRRQRRSSPSSGLLPARYRCLHQSIRRTGCSHARVRVLRVACEGAVERGRAGRTMGKALSLSNTFASWSRRAQSAASDPVLRMFRDVAGVDEVLYGTDFPYLRRDLAVKSKQELLQSFPLNDLERRAILGGNAVTPISAAAFASAAWRFGDAPLAGHNAVGQIRTPEVQCRVTHLGKLFERRADAPTWLKTDGTDRNR